MAAPAGTSSALGSARGEPRRVVRLLLGACLAAGCATTSAQIVTDTRDLSEATGTPAIDSVDDAGAADVLLTAPFAPGRGDGVAAIGELLWLHGSRFGRRPTVLVAGQAVPILARTDDGGAVVRVPPGAPAGQQQVVLANERGEARAPITVVRRVCVLLPVEKQLGCLEESSEGPGRPAIPLHVAGVEVLAASEDGRAIYVLARDAAAPRNTRLLVVALAAQGGPTMSADVALAGPLREVGAPWALQVATFEGRAALFLAGEEGLALLDLSSPLRPVTREAWRWPRKMGRAAVRRWAVSPDGRWVALADGDDSRLTMFSLTGRGLSEATTLDVLPSFHANGIADLKFSRDGRSLGVLVGATADGARVGNSESTRLVHVVLGNERTTTPLWSLGGETPLPQIRWPTALRQARVRALENGASIRRTSSVLPWFVAGQGASDAGHAVFLRVQGDVVKAAGEVAGTVLGLADAPDARWLLASVADSLSADDQVKGPWKLEAVAIDDRPGGPVTVSLSAATGSVPRRELARGLVLEVQP